jgi:uncharacterized cupredoxin-like copper-binding protein
MRPTRVLIGGGVLLAGVAAAGLALADGSAGEDEDGDGALGPGPVTVELGIEHSAFSFDELTVREGTRVRFVVDNGDPILHELIVGPPEVHERHENGTEAAHPPRPGEVTVQPLTAGVTTYAFDEPGAIEFACHLPGHLAYGMSGTVTVLPA